MNWYKIAKNFLRDSYDIDNVVNDIFSKIKKMDLNEIEHGDLITQIMINNPYLNISVPVAIYAADNIGGDENYEGGCYTNIYDIIEYHQKEGRKLEGLEVIETDQDNGYNPYEIIFSDYDNYMEDEGIEALDSYIHINLNNHESDGDLKNTIYHELNHILDPATRSANMNNVQKSQGDYGAYLNNILEYNVRMTAVKNEILYMLTPEIPINDKISTLKTYIEYIKNGKIEWFLESLELSGNLFDDFATYYLQDPKMYRMTVEQISRMLFNLLNKYQNNITKMKNYELV